MFKFQQIEARQMMGEDGFSLELKDALLRVRFEIYKNFETLKDLLDEYFETGTGKNLSQDEKRYVTFYAGQFIFPYSVLKLGKELPTDVKSDFHKKTDEYGIWDFYRINASRELSRLSDSLGLSKNQLAGLDKRGSVLAEKATGIR